MQTKREQIEKGRKGESRERERERARGGGPKYITLTDICIYEGIDDVQPLRDV